MAALHPIQRPRAENEALTYARETRSFLGLSESLSQKGVCTLSLARSLFSALEPHAGLFSAFAGLKSKKRERNASSDPVFSLRSAFPFARELMIRTFARVFMGVGGRKERTRFNNMGAVRGLSFTLKGAFPPHWLITTACPIDTNLERRFNRLSFTFREEQLLK